MRLHRIRKLLTGIATVAMLGGAISPVASADDLAANTATTTPIQHVVVIFQENVSFDHYFATYPVATNPTGEPSFIPNSNTSAANGLSGALLTSNANLANPFRLDRSQAVTCDQGHAYKNEQEAYNAGLANMFVQDTGNGGTGCTASTVMGYYDGNTVTALWNYAQQFAMSDNSFSTGFGPSTPGALNLVSGQTNGATPNAITNSVSNGTVIGDPNPAYDDCSGTSTTISMSGTNVGDLLNAKGITWGWFEGGFTPTSTTTPAVCGSTSTNIAGATITDYIPHHEPFQYFASTSNPHHLPPSSTNLIGSTDQANHQYDLTSFWAAVNAGHMPAVSFLKAKAYQDGHAGYSDPLDEQTFLVDTLNQLQALPIWKSTAVIVAYDDSDGWYDHQMPPIVSQSNDAAYDALTAPGMCGTAPAGAFQDRCGYGPRQPLLVISPWSKLNFVDHTITDQTSILRFIEDNWSLGQIGNQSMDAKANPLTNLFDFAKGHATVVHLYLDPTTGEPTGAN